MSTHNLILAGVFVYFAIGAVQATALTALTMGFAGSFDPRVILVFLFWPIWYIARIPMLGLIAVAISAAAGMTWLASWVIT